MYLPRCRVESLLMPDFSRVNKQSMGTTRYAYLGLLYCAISLWTKVKYTFKCRTVNTECWCYAYLGLHSHTKSIDEVQDHSQDRIVNAGAGLI